jgi:hypothetical protein
MKFPLLFLVLFSLLGSACNNDVETGPVEPVVEAYDTLELRYQQRADLVMDMMSNISTDAGIQTNHITEMLETQPVVSIDFRKPVTTRKDIVNFITFQKKIDAEVQKLFTKLGDEPKWQAAPLIQEYRERYDSLKDSIDIATRQYNSVVKEAKLMITIPTGTDNRKN